MLIRSLTPQQAAEIALAIAVQQGNLMITVENYENLIHD